MYYDAKASGLRIQQSRKAAGFTLEEVSDRLNVSDRQLRRIEKGESSGSVDLLVEISCVLESPWIICLKEKPPIQTMPGVCCCRPHRTCPRLRIRFEHDIQCPVFDIPYPKKEKPIKVQFCCNQGYLRLRCTLKAEYTVIEYVPVAGAKAPSIQRYIVGNQMKKKNDFFLQSLVFHLTPSISTGL